jgi:DMSO reductase anchor subunit
MSDRWTVVLAASVVAAAALHAPVPLALAVLALLAGAGGVAPALLLTFAAILALGGLLVERWLMFAEATHTVTLYYTGR